MDEKYFVIDIETCPINLAGYGELGEEGQKKLINPIDSRIVAIGIRHGGKNKVFMHEDEKKMLGEFWAEWKRIQNVEEGATAVGFNIHEFDLPFITTRSFINNVEISPFLLKYTVDLREKIAAYRWGRVKGRLRDFGASIGLDIPEEGGEMVAKWYGEKELGKIKEHLESDLEVTDEVYKRAKETKILEIERW